MPSMKELLANAKTIDDKIAGLESVSEVKPQTKKRGRKPNVKAKPKAE